MKRKSIVLLLLLMICCMTGCGQSESIVAVNVENADNIARAQFGVESLIKIGGGLWYDAATRNVYWWNGYLGTTIMTATKTDTTPTPYYAPNGLPYQYNPVTNTLEENSYDKGKIK